MMRRNKPLGGVRPALAVLLRTEEMFSQERALRRNGRVSYRAIPGHHAVLLIG